MIAFFRFVLITMMLVLIATVAAVITMRFAIHGAEVSIPDFKGMSVAAATQKAATLGVNMSVEGGLYSTELPAGRVLTQSPLPGTVVRREWQVRVTSSLGPRRVEIPDVLGEQERLAGISIQRIGLELGAIAHMPDAQVPPGTVISQNPLPSAAGVERPSVSILVADAQLDVPDAFIMPDYVGKESTAAAAELARAGLPPATERDALPAPDGRAADTPNAARTGSGAETLIAVGKPGVVVRQSPAPGERLTAHTAVLFDVAR